jgi:hypothetical protein
MADKRKLRTTPAELKDGEKLLTDNVESKVDIKGTSAQTQQRKGVQFKSLWKDFKILWPHLWPKGRYLLQLQIYICLFILVLGRVINVFLPILQKWIGEFCK